MPRHAHSPAKSVQAHPLHHPPDERSCRCTATKVKRQNDETAGIIVTLIESETSMRESRTALGVAWLRAAHQVLDSGPLILKDTAVIELLGRDVVERVTHASSRLQVPGARLLRSHVVLRSRFTEDRLEQSLGRGVKQFVILGAGYDTFFARQPAWAEELKIFEIDQSATQADKLARIAAAGMKVPSNVIFGSVNFEVESMEDGLQRHGVNFHTPTVFSWLGVTMYLTESAIDATLNAVLQFPRGSEIVLTFASRETEDLSDAAADAPSRRDSDVASGSKLAAIVAGIGEPWITYYQPDEIERKLRGIAFSDVLLFTPEMASERYFAGRADALPPPRKTSLLSAIV
jgi:methyltransferase (TIGR00027 family)